jgi:hypothetical protein
MKYQMLNVVQIGDEKEGIVAHHQTTANVVELKVMGNHLEDEKDQSLWMSTWQFEKLVDLLHETKRRWLAQESEGKTSTPSNYRKSGRTTRTVDILVQQFFENGECYCKYEDHSGSLMEDRRLMQMVINRLRMEHPMVDFSISRDECIIKMDPQYRQAVPMNRYYAAVQRHDDHIANYRKYLKKICNHLGSFKHRDSFTVEEITRIMTGEIDMSASCDAPNKPGYDRANND